MGLGPLADAARLVDDLAAVGDQNRDHRAAGQLARPPRGRSVLTCSASGPIAEPVDLDRPRGRGRRRAAPCRRCGTGGRPGAASRTFPSRRRASSQRQPNAVARAAAAAVRWPSRRGGSVDAWTAARRRCSSGATGGLGRAIARALAGRGAHARAQLAQARGARRARRLAARRGPPRRSSPTSPRTGAAERLVADAGDIDVLVANAGAAGVGQARELQRGRARAGAAGQLRGADPDGARAAARRCASAAAGHFVFVSSLAGKAASPAHLALLRDQVRPARLRPRPARGPARDAASASRSSCPASSATPGCSPTRREAAAGPRDAARRRRSPTGVVRAIQRDAREVEVAPRRPAASRRLRAPPSRARRPASSSAAAATRSPTSARAAASREPTECR